MNSKSISAVNTKSTAMMNINPTKSMDNKLEVTQDNEEEELGLPNLPVKSIPVMYLSPKSTETKLDGKQDYDLRKFRASRLKFLNKINTILAIFCAANILSNTANGILPTTLSTIEKRYNLRTFYSSLFIIAHEVGVIVSIFIIGSLGKKIIRPLIVCISLVITGCGCLITILPQFITSYYYPPFWDPKRQVIKIDLCQYEDVPRNLECPQASSRNICICLFILGRFLIGIGNLPILSTSFVFMKNFMDDDCEMCSILLYLSIASGPELGSVISTFFLTFYVDFYKDNIESKRLDEDNSSFIGCWWLPYAVISALCFLGSFFSYNIDQGFHRKYSGDKPKTGILKADSSKEKVQLVNNLIKFMKLLQSSDFILSTCFAAFQSFIIHGMVFYGPKILQNLVIIPAHVAGGLFSVILLPSGLVGLISGMMVIQKFRLSPAMIVYGEFILSAIVIYLLPAYLLVCDAGLFAGINYPVSGNLNKTELYAECNLDCHCTNLPYHPTCSIHGVEYYSACHAGCTRQTTSIKESLVYQKLLNCSCIPNIRFDETVPSATDKPCKQTSCMEGLVMIVMLSSIIAILYFCHSLNQKFLFEVTKYYDLTSVYLLQAIFVRCLGTLPAAIIYGYIIDKNCGLWQIDSCGKQLKTMCVRYNSKYLSRDLVITNIVAQLICCQLLIVLNNNDVATRDFSISDDL